VLDAPLSLLASFVPESRGVATALDSESLKDILYVSLLTHRDSVLILRKLDSEAILQRSKILDLKFL